MFSENLICAWEFVSYGNSARLWGFFELQAEFNQDVIVCSIIMNFTKHTVRKRDELEPHLHESQILPQKQWDAILSTSQNYHTLM